MVDGVGALQLIFGVSNSWKVSFQNIKQILMKLSSKSHGETALSRRSKQVASILFSGWVLSTRRWEWLVNASIQFFPWNVVISFENQIWEPGGESSMKRAIWKDGKRLGGELSERLDTGSQLKCSSSGTIVCQQHTCPPLAPLTWALLQRLLGVGEDLHVLSGWNRTTDWGRLPPWPVT